LVVRIVVATVVLAGSTIGVAVIALAGIALFVTDESDSPGRSKAQALVGGDQAVALESVQIDSQQRRVVCTDPVALRYLEDCLRHSDPDRKRWDTTYRVQFRFVGGGILDAFTYWSGDGFSISMPDEDGTGEHWPTRGIVFQPPVPPAVEEMAAFLERPWQEVKGTVLFLEPGGTRREFERALVAE
jgi:hypothetical protein